MANREIREMIKDADESDIDTDGPRVIGKVTFEEFEVMMSATNNTKSAKHWRSIQEKAPLVKGTKKAMKMLDDLNAKKHARDSQILESRTKENSSSEKLNLSFVPLPLSEQSPSNTVTSTRYPTYHSTVDDQTPPTSLNPNALSERELALHNVKLSLSILTLIAILRRIILRV